MRLPEKIASEVKKLSRKGARLLDDGKQTDAIVLFEKAYDLLPNPKEDWEATTWLCSYMGDAYYELHEFEKAFACFKMAEKIQESNVNPFVLLRLGECLFRMGNVSQASEYIIGAYMLEGDELFVDEPRDVLDLLEKIK